MTYISPKPVSLQALRTWLDDAAASGNGRTPLARLSFTRAGVCLQFVWLHCNNSLFFFFVSFSSSSQKQGGGSHMTTPLQRGGRPQPHSFGSIAED